MGDDPWQSTEDYSSHTPEKDFDYAPPFKIQMIQSTWQKSSLSSSETFTITVGNTCAQVYATDFGLARALPMASKSEAHET